MFKKKRWKTRPQNTDTESKIVLSPEKARQKTFDRAVNLLTYKARSINELRLRLLEKDWADEIIVDEVIEKLKFYGYLNDKTFAKNLANSKLRQKPIGKRLLQQKMALTRQTIQEAIETLFTKLRKE